MVLASLEFRALLSLMLVYELLELLHVPQVMVILANRRLQASILISILRKILMVHQSATAIKPRLLPLPVLQHFTLLYSRNPAQVRLVPSKWCRLCR